MSQGPKLKKLNGTDFSEHVKDIMFHVILWPYIKVTEKIAHTFETFNIVYTTVVYIWHKSLHNFFIISDNTILFRKL